MYSTINRRFGYFIFNHFSSCSKYYLLTLINLGAFECACIGLIPPWDDRVVYSSKELLSATNNDILPTLEKSNVIYQFLCLCNSQYVGRKNPLLSFPERTVPARLCKSSIQNNTQSLASDSAIGLHLLQKPACSLQYDDSRFFFFSSFHQSTLEATFIKTSKPFFC